MEKLNLLSIEKDVFYYIEKIDVEDEGLKNQLINLGFIENEKIMLLDKSFGSKSFLVKVMGVNYSVGKNVCEKIYVRK